MVCVILACVWQKLIIRRLAPAVFKKKLGQGGAPISRLPMTINHELATHSRPSGRPPPKVEVYKIIAPSRKSTSDFTLSLSEPLPDGGKTG
jgi:hypothetical protein